MASRPHSWVADSLFGLLLYTDIVVGPKGHPVKQLKFDIFFFKSKQGMIVRPKTFPSKSLEYNYFVFLDHKYPKKWDLRKSLTSTIDKFRK